MTILDRILLRWRRPDQRWDAARKLDRAAHYLTDLYTNCASFRDRGTLLPYQADAISLLISLQRRIIRNNQ
jgi:hypothetical protein